MNVGLHPYGSSSDGVFNPHASGTNIPLTSTDNPYESHQQWDKNGQAIGYSGNPLHAPIPQRRPQFREEEDFGHVYPSGSRDGRTPIRQDSDESINWEQPAQQRSHIPSPPGLQSNAASGDAAYGGYQPSFPPAQSSHLPSPYEPGHQQEATNDSYHTAMTSHSRVGTGAASPTPPSYRTVQR